METMTSKYLTASRARHVTFPRVFPIGLWGVRYSLFIIYSWLYPCNYLSRECGLYKASDLLLGDHVEKSDLSIG